MIQRRKTEMNPSRRGEKLMFGGAAKRTAVLFHEFFKARGGEHANAKLNQFGRRPTGQSLGRPAWQGTNRLSISPANPARFILIFYCAGLDWRSASR